MTNSNYSFTSAITGNSYGQQSHQGRDNVNKPSIKQYSYYRDLCARKRVEAQTIDKFTFSTLRDAIDVLRQQPDPASEKQLDIIHRTLKELEDLGDTVKVSPEYIAKLTGGTGGTASLFIEKLFERRQNFADTASPSEQQLKIIVEWFLCPDIPFESISVEHTQPMKPGANVAESYTDTISINRKVALDGTKWRWMTPDEFAQEVASKMSRRQASRFIDQYRGVFYDWKSTRVTANQIKYIKELENRMANLYVPKPVEMAITPDGEVMEISKSSARDYNPNAYVPMEDIHLYQLSYEQASEFIDKLKSELSDRELSSVGSPYDERQQDFHDLTRAQSTKNQNDAILKEYTALSDLMYGLESINGYTHDTLHTLIRQTLMEGMDDKSLEARTMIKDFMYESLDVKNGQQLAKNIGRLQTMCEASVIATEILDEMLNELQ